MVKKEADETKNGTSQSPRAASGSDANTKTSPKPKRRKVNHACLYCRRSHMTCEAERPCTRCIKRNIGHLCHDEPREPAKKGKGEQGSVGSAEEMAQKNDGQFPASSLEQQQVDRQLMQESVVNPNLPRNAASRGSSGRVIGDNARMYGNYGSEWRQGNRNQLNDVNSFHPSYMFNAPEVTNEYNLLNDFLSTSLLDDGAMFSGEETHPVYTDPTPINTIATNSLGFLSANNLWGQGQQGPNPLAASASAIKRPASTAPTDKAQETYYLAAADPAGNDPPETRLNELLQAKYDAGMLRPFNYVKGYARLNKYMEQNMQAASRQKILRQLDKFRPKFRERMQGLTDVELVLVEMWFERCLMDYDRVFASMAVPACCWRRTGEIFRGNEEMAELIGVPIESLRDGKLAIHEIIVENHLVNYWEMFGSIAFDKSQKAMLTSCSLKNPHSDSKESEISCCFSFTIRRDSYEIPSLIVGNFLPMNAPKKRANEQSA